MNSAVTVPVDGSLFSFPAGWEVEAYDTWTQVAKIAGSSLEAKACDLVAISGGTLYLIEVKDYTYPVGTRPPKLEDLAVAVAQKGYHTLAGLFAVAHLPIEKAAFCSRALRCERIELYLSVELPADKGLLFTQRTMMVEIRELLTRKVRPFLAVKPLVVSRNSGGAPWTSARDPNRRSRATR